MGRGEEGSGIRFALDASPPQPAGLLIDVAESLTLLALLEQTSGGHDQDDIDANHAENPSEDVVDEDVRKRGDRCCTATVEGSSGRAGAGGIRHKGRRGAVKITTAVELNIQSQ